MSPLELAIVLSAVDNASRLISQVQEKLEGLAKVGERMIAVGEGMTFAGGLIRAAGDALGFADAARSAMSFQDEIARVNTVLPPTAKGLQDLSRIQEFAIAQSQKHAYAAEQVAESVYMGLSSFLSTRQTMAATTVAEQVAVGMHGQLADVMLTLGTLYLNFADKAKPAQAEFQRLGDVMTTLQTQFAFKDMGEITSALQYATAAAQQFHVPLNTALASIAGFSAAGLHGAEAGTAFAEMMNAVGRGAMEKLGVPISHARDGTLDLRASLDNLAQWIRTHPDFGSAEKLTKAFGIRGARAELLIQQLGKLDTAQRALEGSTGAAARAQQIAEATASGRYQILKNNLEAVAERLADVALPALTRWIDGLASAAHAAADFLARHQTIATVLAGTATALGVLTTAAGGLLLTLGPIVIAGGYTLKLIASFGPALRLAASGWETLGLRAMYAWQALSQGEGVMAALSELVGPWGLLVAGAVALGLAAYEVYEHWSTVKKVFVEIVDGAEAALGNVLSFVKNWGVELLEALVAPWAMLPTEIFKHIDETKDAAGKVAHAISRFFVGHSPIPEGPLHDLNLSRAIAMTLTPLPVLAPAMQTAAAIARPFGTAGRSGGGTITVNYSPTINISGSASPREEWVKTAREHARELMRIIRDVEFRERRLQFR